MEYALDNTAVSVLNVLILTNNLCFFKRNSLFLGKKNKVLRMREHYVCKLLGGEGIYKQKVHR